MTDLERRLAFLTEIDKMKCIYRKNIVIDRSRNEDDASHSWHMAMCALVLADYAPNEIDMLTVLKMCLVHDLVEIYAGDTYCYDAAGHVDKLEREQKAADKLFAMLPGEQGTELRTLWEKFDALDGPEACYAAAIDRMQPFLLNYNTDGHTWHFAKVTRKMLEKRLGPVKDALPAVWEQLQQMIEVCLEKGWLYPEPDADNE